MHNEWLAASSFERMHELIAAITTLSIHTKLAMAGRADPSGPTEVEQARSRLLDFLHHFAALLDDTEHSHDGPMVGADPRLGDLAMRYLAHKQRSVGRAPLYDVSFADLASLIAAPQPQDYPMLIAHLRDLRALLEQHAHADVSGLLGEV